MAVGLNKVAETPGGGGRGAPLFFKGPRTGEMALYTVSFPNPYVAGGVSIAGIWDDFQDNAGKSPIIMVEPRGSGFVFEVDYTAKKLKLFTAIGTESSGVDRSAVTNVRLMVVGNPKRV